MKSLSKFAVIFPLVCLLALAAVIISTALPAAGIALADDAAFDIVYPEKGYFPIEDATLVAASDDIFVIYDSASDSFLAAPHTRESVTRIPADGCADVTGIWLAGNVLLIAHGGTSKTFSFVDLSDLSSAPSVQPADGIKNASAVSYIAADDERFYVKYDSYLTVYSAADFSVVGDERFTLNDALIGPNVFTAEDMKVYVYAAEYGDRGYYILDLDTKFSTPITTEIYPYSVSMSDGIVYASAENGIVAVDRDTSEVKFPTGIPSSKDTVFAAGGGMIYVLENGAVDVYSVTTSGSDAGAEFECTLTISGGSGAYLASPSDILVTAAGTFVADAGSSRVILFSDDGTSVSVETDFSPVALAADDSGMVYVASEDRIYTLQAAGGSFRTAPYCGIPEGETVIDIAHTGSELVILTSSSLWYVPFMSTTPVRVIDIADGIALSTARGDVLYALTERGIRTLSTANGAPVDLIPFRDYDFSGATDIAADYAGTLFVSYGETGIITAFDNALSAVTEKATFTLTHPLAQARPVAFALYGSKVLFLSSTCFVGSAEVGAVDSESYIPVPEPDTDAAENLSFAVLSADGHIFAEPSRFDTMSPVSAGTVVLCYNGISSWEGYTYVYAGGKTGYVETSSLTPVSPTAIGSAYTLHAGSALYKHPASDAITAENDVILTVTDDAAGLDDGTWVRVSLNGGTYFALASDLTPYTPPVPEREEKFGRASSDRPGGLIGIYSLPDISSVTVTEAVDGTRMEIVGEEGDFWMVSFDGFTGYALKSEVELEGLTTVQIVSIVLCCAVAVTGAVIFVVIWQARKKEKEKE